MCQDKIKSLICVINLVSIQVDIIEVDINIPLLKWKNEAQRGHLFPWVPYLFLGSKWGRWVKTLLFHFYHY